MAIKLNKDLISGGGLIAISILFLTVLIPKGVQVPLGQEIAVLSPDFWIKIIVWTLLLLGCMLFATGIQLAKEPATSEQDNDSVTENDYRPGLEGLAYVALAFVLLFIFYQGINYLGMMASSIIAIIVFTRVSGERRWKYIISIALILPVILYYFFLKVAGIPMPLGIFN